MPVCRRPSVPKAPGAYVKGPSWRPKRPLARTSPRLDVGAHIRRVLSECPLWVINGRTETPSIPLYPDNGLLVAHQSYHWLSTLWFDTSTPFADGLTPLRSKRGPVST